MWVCAEQPQSPFPCAWLPDPPSLSLHPGEQGRSRLGLAHQWAVCSGFRGTKLNLGGDSFTLR